jgi:hypothetical protein
MRYYQAHLAVRRHPQGRQPSFQRTDPDVVAWSTAPRAPLRRPLSCRNDVACVLVASASHIILAFELNEF